jgi:hypothetical protein
MSDSGSVMRKETTTYRDRSGGGEAPQHAEVNCSNQEFYISCQDVKFYRSLGMICVWQVFGDFQKFTVIAEIFISNSGRITTICGSRISNEKVWIKVCNPHSLVSVWTADHHA